MSGLGVLMEVFRVESIKKFYVPGRFLTIDTAVALKRGTQ